MNRHLQAVSNLFLDKILLKISSVFLALLLWISINGEPQSETRFKVRLQYLNLPSQIELVDSPTNSVDVQLSASSSILRRLGSSEISAAINLATARVGKGVYSITPSNIEVPFGIRVTNVTPSTVQLNLQSTVSKEVKVHPRIVGMVPDGYQLESVALHPDQVVVPLPHERQRRRPAAAVHQLLHRCHRLGVALGVVRRDVRRRLPPRRDGLDHAQPGRAELADAPREREDLRFAELARELDPAV